jgi:hypothetical protein
MPIFDFLGWVLAESLDSARNFPYNNQRTKTWGSYLPDDEIYA